MTITHRSISVRAARTAGASGLTLCSLLLIACGGGGTAEPSSNDHMLTVNAAGDGSGLVVSNPAGISCTISAGVKSGTCAASYRPGAAVTLTASGAFSAWSGPCSGSAADADCALVVLPRNQLVTAGFGTITSLQGISALATGTGESSMGLVAIGLATFLPGVAPTSQPGAGLNASAAATATSPKVAVTAQLRLIGRSGTISLSGTYDATTGSQQLCLLQAPAGTADPCLSPSTIVWQFRGTLDTTGRGSGVLSGPDPTTPGASALGFFRVEPDSVNTRRSVYCGRFLDANQGELGRWIVTLTGSTIGGMANQSGTFYDIRGRYRVDPYYGTNLDLAPAPGGGPVRYWAYASVSQDRTSIGGDWWSTAQRGGPGGTWSATMKGCD